MSKENTAVKVQIEKSFVIRLTATLLTICAVVACLLAVVNNVTKPLIAEMQAEKTKAAMAQVLTADEYQAMETTAANVTEMYQAISGGQPVGYVVMVTSNGFGGAISMVVGVDMDGFVTGVAVTNHSETANLGTKVVENQEVLDRFVGMTYANGEITVNSGTNRFDGVSGATVSSRGVTAGVNYALAAINQ